MPGLYAPAPTFWKEGNLTNSFPSISSYLSSEKFPVISSKPLVVSAKILIFTDFITFSAQIKPAKVSYEGKRVSFIFTVHH
jgi:hypothetical protein